MKILVTGSRGFAGTHLVAHLKSEKHDVLELRVDLCNATETAGAVAKKRFDGVIHLAAMAATGDSFASPAKILKNTILAQLHLLEAFRRNNSNARILIVCSADEYGQRSIKPIDEKAMLMPTSPYAVSKIAQDFMGLQYFLSYGMPVIRVRPFNHIGEGQRIGFVVPDFVKQIVDIERSGKPGVMTVGNLDATRDFTDVKDMVRAYELALTQGEPGEVYNIGSGTGIRIGDLLDRLIRLSSATISVKVDKTRFRPGESPKLVADSAKFRNLTGWKPTIPLETTLARVLEWWRKQ